MSNSTSSSSFLRVDLNEHSRAKARLRILISCLAIGISLLSYSLEGAPHSQTFDLLKERRSNELDSSLEKDEIENGIDQPFLSQEDLNREMARVEEEKRRRQELERRLNPRLPRERNETDESEIPLDDKSIGIEDTTDDPPFTPIIGDKNKNKSLQKKSIGQRGIESDPTRKQRTSTPKIESGVSAVEQIFAGLYPSEISKRLHQFGYDIFFDQDRFDSTEFYAPTDTPVSKDYILGPGDQFTINVWGGNNFSYSVAVRPDGSIFIPKIGTISVWGKTFSAASVLIKNRLSDYFSGIKVDIAFDNIRSIDIFVVGEVSQPGRYSLPSTSAVINALFRAGGPNKNGSLRNIKIVRNNQEVATVDLYDFLIDGKINQQKLQSQDVILVPVIGKLAAIAGHAKRPAIYEWKGDTTVYDLLMMGGGLKFTGSAGRLSLERVVQGQKRITKDYLIPADIRNLTRAQAIKTELGAKIEDGDLASVFSILPEKYGTIHLRGHVQRPGAYEFRPGMKLSSLIRSFSDLKPEPYTQYLEIIRTVPPKDERKALFTPLEEVLKGNPTYDLALQDRDQIIVFSKSQLKLQERVSIFGKVNKPGDYAYFQGMTLRDLIFMAGNVTQDAYKASAEIARFKIADNGMKSDRIQVDLRLALSSNPSSNPTLEPKDRISVYGLPNFETQNFVDLVGEVQFPGRYSFLPNERLSSLLKRAGGFTPKAFLRGAFFSRKSVKELQEKSLKEQITRLEEAILYEEVNPNARTATVNVSDQQEAMAGRRTMLRNLQSAQASGRMIIELRSLKDFENSRQDIPLEGGDTLNIPSQPSVVNIMGEVFNQTSVVYVPNKTIDYYLDRAGGATANGEAGGIFIIHADGSVTSRKQNRGFLLRDFMRTPIDRGDTILVPKDISRFSWLSTTKDITEILFKIASTTGITITAFK